jgi:hypothetical protein
MDFIAAATTLLSTTLTSPASPIEIYVTLGRRTSYRSGPSSATAAVPNMTTTSFIKFQTKALGAPLFAFNT